MIQSKFLDDIAQKISELVPKPVKDLQADLEKNIKAVLHNAFGKMDLVTREEFDAQVKVLARTRAKVVELEAIVKQMTDDKKKR